MTKAQARRDAAAAARAALFGGSTDDQVPTPAAAPTGARAKRASKRDQPLPVGTQAPKSDIPSAAIPDREPPPAHTLEHLLPRKWTGDPPQEGDLVFFRGGRWWIEPPVPLNFADSVWFRIGDHRVPKPVIDETTGIRVHRPLNENRTSFYVHIDELSAVPPEVRNVGIGSRLPTLASIGRAERAKAGVRDVGDEVATLLRGCDTLDKMYSVASEYLGVPVPDLQAKYQHLNNGQQRMNLGNRMRAKWRKTHG